MPAEHPRGDADASHSDSDASTGDTNARVDRRTFLRRTTAAGTGLATGAAGLGTATVDGVSAQEGTGTETGAEEGEEEADTVTTRGAFAADAPMLGNSDYTGLFVHVAGVNQDASTRNVSGCPFVESDDAVVAYDVTLIDRESAGTPQGDTLLFAEVDDDTVEYGKLFIVTGQRSCGSEHTEVQLEEVGAANIRTAGAGANDGADSGTETSIPGFGVGATVAGLIGGGELLRRRRSE
ncbi:PGF-CTERM sorting domain-containing protein [Halorarum halophilum]|uniref:PGF-CTERM sorting domain-containing protein n=1 Tax=Halorarum halophilum TaxID=2743090 RepID=A0A7D5KUV3_9EURY|nr:PGF-CTERM sorting domain-containing protein [Halobaculum halophilum]QLG28000.1 PGF-CTERM sorting domain-containing protein [Halobaculum halophilum]